MIYTQEQRKAPNKPKQSSQTKNSEEEPGIEKDKQDVATTSGQKKPSF